MKNDDLIQIKNERQRIVALDLKDAFAQVSRNGRWGTCGGCPHTAGLTYPEFCENTLRYDHQITVTVLADRFERELDLATSISETIAKAGQVAP